LSYSFFKVREMSSLRGNYLSN
ncbi:MAG: cytochrome c oxidase assembly protein, partial [Rickettsia conorii subsp. raoultii]